MVLTPEHERFLEAVRDLDAALNQTMENVQAMKRRAREILDAAVQDRPLREVVPLEQRPLLVQLLTHATDTLQSYGNRVRTTEAHALYSEGMTMDQIARLFGVSRQRVSTLLRGRND